MYQWNRVPIIAKCHTVLLTTGDLHDLALLEAQHLN